MCLRTQAVGHGQCFFLGQLQYTTVNIRHAVWPQSGKYYSWGGWLSLTLVTLATWACQSLHPSKWDSGDFSSYV